MNSLAALWVRRVRGVRVVDLAAAACLILMVLVVYWSKTAAGAEAAKIAETNKAIAAEEQKVRVLRAQHAWLAQPERLRRLSEQYLGMAPIPPVRETQPEALIPAVAAQPATPPVVQPEPAR